VEAVELATLDWVDGFNHQWLLELISNIPPAEAEAEANYYRQQVSFAQAALLKPNSIRDSRSASVDGWIPSRPTIESKDY
jgi:hypothetical protein